MQIAKFVKKILNGLKPPFTIVDMVVDIVESKEKIKAITLKTPFHL